MLLGKTIEREYTTLHQVSLDWSGGLDQGIHQSELSLGLGIEREMA